MPEYTDTMTVVFVMEYATITTTVGDPDIDDWSFVVNQANDIIGDEHGIYPKKMAKTIIVTNKYGEEIEET